MLHDRRAQPAEDVLPASPVHHDDVSHAADDDDPRAAPPFAAMQRRALAATLAERVTTAASPLPFQAELERAFGRSLDGIRAHLGEGMLLGELGARAAAEGEVIAFAEHSPSRTTVAHEVTHVLQARSGRAGGGANAEREAERVAADVTAHRELAPITEGAEGVHFDGGDAPQTVSASGFVKEMMSVEVITIMTLHLAKVIESHPYARYIGSGEELLRAMFGWGTQAAAYLKPFEDKIAALIQPESFTKLVDEARAAESGWGPAHHVYIEPVGFALGNALARQLRKALTRILPRYVNLAAVEATPSGPGVIGPADLHPTHVVNPTELVPSHPLDRVLAYGLCFAGAKVDAGRFALEHPDLVKQGTQQGRKVGITFPWEKKLWHWVEADVADASAEEVADALFGSPDQAFRLTAMAPLFGFRASDVAAMKPEHKAMLDQLAAEHHPDPGVTNWSDMAAFDQAKHEEWKAAHPEAAGYGGGGGDPLDAGMAPSAGVLDPEPDWTTDPARPAPRHAFPQLEVDPAVELAAALGADYARKRAIATGDGAQHDELEVADKLTDARDVLQTARTAFAALGLATGGLDALDRKLASRLRAAQEICLIDATGDYLLAAAQAKALNRVAKGANDTVAHVALFGGVSQVEGAEVPRPDDLKGGARDATLEATEAWESAAAALDLPELATPRIEHAESLTRTLRITVLEKSLHHTGPGLVHAIETPGDRHANGATYDPMEKSRENDRLLAELAVLRVRAETDPAAAEKQLGDTSTRAGDYLFEMSVIGNFEALDQVWKLVNDEHGFWVSLANSLNGYDIESDNRGYYARFKKVYDDFEAAKAAGDKAGKEAARTAFKELVDDTGFQNHFKRVKEHLEDVAFQKKWTKIIAGIAIAVVAMALGQVYFSALLLETGSVFLAATGAAIVETGANVVLSKLILDADPTAGSLITGFIGAGAMYAVIGRALVAGRAAGVSAELAEATERASTLQKAGKFAVDLTKEALLVQVIGLVQADIANYIDHGTHLSDDQIGELLVHNLAGLVGMKIGQRVVDVTLDPFAPFKGVGAKHGIDVQGLLKEQGELRELALEVERTKDPALAQKLVDRERAFLERIDRVREQLLALAKQHPGEVPAKNAKTLEQMGEHAGADPEVVRAQALMSLEEVGPGLYRADARAFDAILAMHKDAHDRVVAVETDPKSGLRTIKVETPEGQQVRIKEKLPAAGERTGPPVPVEDALAFEHWLEHEAVFGPEPAASATRDRLREYYARDPEAAIALAKERYGHVSTTPVTPEVSTHPAAKADQSAASRAYDQFLYEKRGDGVDQSRIGDAPVMDRADFQAMYERGFHYDPVAREWVAAAKTEAGTIGAIPHGADARTTVLGELHSEAVGHEIMRKLVNGEAEALRIVGLEAEPGFDPRSNEWGLGRRASDGAIVLVRGGRGEINWKAIPDIEDLAHSHPLKDPITGEDRLIQGTNGGHEINVNDPGSFTFEDLLYVMPSSGDLRFVALNKRAGHRVHTPYVALGDGRIGNPQPGHLLDTVEIVVVKSEPVGLFSKDSSIVVWKAELEFRAGDRVLNNKPFELYSKRMGDGTTFSADWPTLTADYHPLPADHPILGATGDATPMATPPTKINHVEVGTIEQLVGFKLDPGDAATHTLLAGLSPKEAATLAFVTQEALGGQAVDGFAHWLERLKTDKAGAIKDAQLVQRELAADPAAVIKYDTDGKPLFSSSSRHEVPARVVDHVKAVANSEAKAALKPYADAAADPAAVERVRVAATKKGEDAFVAELAAGTADKQARDAATKAVNRETKAQAVIEAERAAQARAEQAMTSGAAFGPLDAQATHMLTEYRAGTVGMAARRLAGELTPLVESKQFLDHMAKEVSDGNCPPPRKISINGPPKQDMTMWEYPDGSEIRYKPLGDKTHPNPTFTIEVKKDATVPDAGRDDAAFKVRADGTAVPKNDLELANPYAKTNPQHKAFEEAVLGPIHFNLKP